MLVEGKNEKNCLVFKFKKLMRMFKNLVRFLIDLRFAIILLVLICFVIALGSIVEQDEPSQYYIDKYPGTKPILGFFSSGIIFTLGLDHIYRSGFFLFLLFLLGSSLFFCTLHQQIPNLLLAKDLVFFKFANQISCFPFFQVFDLNFKFVLEAEILQSLKTLNFYTHQQKNSFYAAKGLFGKVGPILVHFSLICILVGAILGAFGRYSSQEFVSRGEIIHVQNILGSGVLSFFPKITLRLNDFWIEYNHHKINQFYSNVSLLTTSGFEQINGTIAVNLPLSFQEIVMYQTDWNLLGIRILKDFRAVIEYPLTLISSNPKVWVSSISNGSFLLVDDLRQGIKLYDKFGIFLQQVNFGEVFVNKSFNYLVIDCVCESGLQIKFDPSIPFIFFGFGILIFSTFLSYLTYTEIWFCLAQNKLFLGGQTSRSNIWLHIFSRNLISYLITK